LSLTKRADNGQGGKKWPLIVRRQGCRSASFHYIEAVNYLTRQERIVLCIVVGLLLTGWLVKWYRAAHPPVVAAQQPVP
jgi:hypothetical protein